MVIKGMFFPRRNFIINSTLPILFILRKTCLGNSFYNIPLARMYYIHRNIFTVNLKCTYFNRIWASYINLTVIHIYIFQFFFLLKEKSTKIILDIRTCQKKGLIPYIWPNTEYGKGQIPSPFLVLNHSTFETLLSWKTKKNSLN